MKRIILFVVAVLAVFLLTGCDNGVASTNLDNRMETNDVEMHDEDMNDEMDFEGISDSPIDLLEFYSLEEFEAAIENATEGGDIADLASLEMYYLPTGIPEGYKLYKILAGVVDIGFFYLPEACLESEDSIFEAEAQCQYYQFVSPRNTHKFENVQEQFGIADDEIVNDYFVRESATDVVYWNKNGDALMLYLPREDENEDESEGEKGAAEYMFDIDDIDISELLTTETVIVE